MGAKGQISLIQLFNEDRLIVLTNSLRCEVAFKVTGPFAAIVALAKETNNYIAHFIMFQFNSHGHV